MGQVNGGDFSGDRRGICRRYLVLPAVVLAAWAFHSPSAWAWVFHEHQVIAEVGIQQLKKDELHQLDGIWQQVRAQAKDRLCPAADRIDYDVKGHPRCVNLAAWAAIAGDHSCTAEDLWSNATTTDWILGVMAISNDTRLQLKQTKGRERLRVWNYSNLRYERTDPEYSSRAQQNYSHFLIDRQSAKLEANIKHMLRSDVHINAGSTYAYYHWAALRFALDHQRHPPNSPRRKDLARRALTAEGYALHYLQDAFSSGHIVGRWGGTAQAKGTHDHYCSAGVDAATWEGVPYSAYGDAHMRETDLQYSSAAVTRSIEQLLKAFRGDAVLTEKMKAIDTKAAYRYHRIDSCRSLWVDQRTPSDQATEVLAEVWKKTLVPGPGEDKAHMPRFNSELGFFLGFTAGGQVQGGFSGYDSENEGSPRPSAGIHFYITAGFGVEGATGLSSDGTFLLGVGTHAVAPQFDGVCPNCDDARQIGENVPRVPGRQALSLLMRMPFYLIPGDLLLLAPLVAPFSMTAFKRIAVAAADGGLIPWQTVMITRAGDFQFVIGREVRVTLFGVGGGDIFFRWVPEESDFHALNFSSVMVDFPILQWRFFRAFSQRLTSAVILTVGGGLDFPYGVERITTGDKASLGMAGLMYLRLGFDGRIYFAP